MWSEETTADFLRSTTGRADRAGAEALARSLGGLPLAADQAAAYLRPRPGILFTKYAENIERLIDQAPDAGNLGAYGKTVYATLTTSLAELPGATRDLLCLLSWLSEDGTDVALVAATAERKPELLSEDLAAAFADDFTREDAIKPAADLSLLRREVDKAGFDVLTLHRVTALVLRVWQGREQVAGWDDRAARIVGGVFPFESNQPQFWELSARLLPHARALAARGPESGEGGKKRGYILNQAAVYLSARGDGEGAISLLESSVALAARIHGKKRPEYATGLSNLAGRYAEAGRLEEAEAAYRQVIEIQEAILAPGDPSLAITYNNMGKVYWRKKSFAKAEPLFLRARDIDLAAKGKTGPEYASRTNALGALYDDWAEEPGQGHRRKQAARLTQEAVGLIRQAVGERHPQTSSYLHNLAITRYRESDFAAAAELALRAVAIQLSLGLLQHPDTQDRIGDLLLLWERSGQAARADRLRAGDPSELLPEIAEVERRMHDWVAEDPENRHFGPPPFAEHKGDLAI